MTKFCYQILRLQAIGYAWLAKKLYPFLNFYDTPLCFITLSFNKRDLEFQYKGDTVIWLYPWVRPEREKRFISLTFSGTGEFGDACYASLKELDKEWDDFAEMADKNINGN